MQNHYISSTKGANSIKFGHENQCPKLYHAHAPHGVKGQMGSSWGQMFTRSMSNDTAKDAGNNKTNHMTKSCPKVNHNNNWPKHYHTCAKLGVKRSNGEG